MTGMMTCLVLNQKFSKGDVYPYIGSHLRCTPKRYINRIPSQNIGALTPIFVKEVTSGVQPASSLQRAYYTGGNGHD